MTTQPPGDNGRRPTPKWVKATIGMALIFALVTTAGIAALIIGSRNTGQTAADWIPAFAETTGATTYCANGYGNGIGIDNNVPWWEWTLLADGSPEHYAEELTAALEAHGYKTTASEGTPVEYGEYSALNNPEHLESIGWATSWVRIDATNAEGIAVIARVADAATQNNCFPKSDDIVTPADPSQADVIAVIFFSEPDD